MKQRNVLEWLDSCVGNIPDKVAFCDECESRTFAEVQSVTCSIGTAIAQKVGSNRRPVAVLVERAASSVCCLLGVAASGNFYVPIDSAQPIGRIQAIFGQMQPCAVVAMHDELPDGLSELVREAPGSLELLLYRDLLECQPDNGLLSRIRESMVDTDPLYAICTSGSTGVPKGVLVSHRSVLDFIPVFCETFGFGRDEVFANQAPFDFDVSVKDIYSTLYLGATMQVVPKRCFSMPKLLAPFLEEAGATTVVWAVSALTIVAGFKAFKYQVPSRLRNVLFSGEVMPVKHLRYWQEVFPKAQFVNLYGPTEITCNCMYYIVDRPFRDDEKLPLGRTFANERVLALGEDGRELQPGDGNCLQEGELCVLGTCLALGYYRDPERTAKAFVQNPLNDRYPELMYRTGDLVRYNERGELVYAGRKDFQIKHMGHRIELEELEVHLGAVEGIRRACCLFDQQRNKIVACYVGDIDPEAIVKALGRALPKYMIPNVYHQLEQLPVTKNGKIDRKRLAKDYLR